MTRFTIEQLTATMGQVLAEQRRRGEVLHQRELQTFVDETVRRLKALSLEREDLAGPND